MELMSGPAMMPDMKPEALRRPIAGRLGSPRSTYQTSSACSREMIVP
jgi:hypothetical protein